jgi:hypothetical protein
MLPEGMLEDLGMSREQLEKFIRRYSREAAQAEPAEQESQAGLGERAAGGAVLEAGAGGSEDIEMDSGAALQTEKDSLRSRSDDSSPVSPRYRDALKAYYKRLSEES